MTGGVLYVQKRPHRAGAQTCLARLLRHPGLRPWHPAVVCSESGWLTGECRAGDIPVVLEPFPSSRSLLARLHGNGAFARRVSQQLMRASLRPTIVHANDHLEGLLGLELAKGLKVCSAIFLRSPGMTREDYFKYRCYAYDLIAAVGDELRDRVRGWDPGREIRLIPDGIEAGEFAPPRPRAATFPRRILVIGSPLDWKGWADFVEALVRWEATGGLPDLACDFTGVQPDPAKNNLKLERMRRTRCTFLGRVERFPELVQGYDLAVNPTRMESFGMAAVEVVALGVPLLSSRTGIIEQVIEQPEFLFPPKDPPALADALRNLHDRWDRLVFDAEGCQRNIRAKFLVDRAVTKLTQEYRRLCGGTIEE
jgi:glycosyltransferase involved in cell wall biosynthesis